MKVKVEVSNRHVHLTEEVYQQLFTKPLTKRNDLSQVGDFASNESVTIKTEGGSIENVRIVGPFRSYNQVEIAYSDARCLKINPPVRKSGDVAGSSAITLIGDKGSVMLENACILAERHIHMNPSEATKWNVLNDQTVQVKVEGEKSCLLDAKIKISENGVLAFHIDIDDANATLLKTGDEVEVIL